MRVWARTLCYTPSAASARFSERPFGIDDDLEAARPNKCAEPAENGPAQEQVQRNKSTPVGVASGNGDGGRTNVNEQREAGYQAIHETLPYLI